MRIIVILALLALSGCTSPSSIYVQPEALAATTGSLAQDTEVALEIGWDETLHMQEHPRPRITWWLPCVAPLDKAGDTIVTFAETCSASSVNSRGDIALRWTGSISSSWFADALVGYKGYTLGNKWGYYNGDRLERDEIAIRVKAAGL